jgi:hypothetical protein
MIENGEREGKEKWQLQFIWLFVGLDRSQFA